MQPSLPLNREHSRQTTARSASVLLEVVLALALFVGAATIISTGINASLQSVERVRLQNHAMNMAISIISELHMHARPVAPMGPEPFAAPFEKWTFQIEIVAGEGLSEGSDALRAVEVIIRHSRENVVQRLSELFPSRDLSNLDANPVSNPFPSAQPFSPITP